MADFFDTLSSYQLHHNGILSQPNKVRWIWGCFKSLHFYPSPPQKNLKAWMSLPIWYKDSPSPKKNMGIPKILDFEFLPLPPQIKKLGRPWPSIKFIYFLFVSKYVPKILVANKEDVRDDPRIIKDLHVSWFLCVATLQLCQKLMIVPKNDVIQYK